MSPERLAWLRSELWPETASGPRVYALLDGARDARIHARVLGGDRPRCCLYAGELPAALRETAPYLVQIDRDAPFAESLLRDGWGQSWGIFLWSTGTIEELRRHFRRFLRVQDEHGRRFLFRYYDPRVLRVYLPTCTASELRALFGPVALYLAEGKSPDDLLRFHRDEGALGLHAARFPGPQAAAAPR